MSEQTRDRWLQQFADLMARLAPDAISAGVMLTVVMIAVSLVFGNPATQVMDAYYRGLWMLLPFTMQMTLIIVLSQRSRRRHSFAESSPLSRGYPEQGTSSSRSLSSLAG